MRPNMKPRVSISSPEMNCIEAIVNRALVFFPDRIRSDIQMDLIAVHLKTPLRLQDLLDADDGNFVHDIAGIERHLDHATFSLRDCFVPRFAETRFRNPNEEQLRRELGTQT